MKTEGLLGIDGDVILYGCPICAEKLSDNKRIIAIADVVVYRGSYNGMFYGKLPLCPKCNSGSYVIPNEIADTMPAHLRRIVIARAIDNGQLMEGTTEEDATACRQLLKEFYTKKGDADLDAEFEGTVEVKRFVEGYEQESVAE